MIPTFPNFAPISLDQKAAVEGLVKDHDPYSDFNFISMYCWDKGGIALCVLHNNLVVRFNHYLNPENQFLSFLGVHNVKATANTLLEYSKLHLGVEQLELIPEITAKKLQEKGFVVEPDENQHDYVYSIEEHISLAGGKFKKRRNLLKKFNEEYPDQARVDFEQELSEERWNQMITVVKDWSAGKKEADSYSEEEYTAFLRLRDCHTLADFFYFFVYVKEELVGLSVAEVVNKDYVMFHFEKIVPLHGGISPFSMNKMAEILHQYNFSYINFMQDIGIPGMKQNKQLRRPIHMLHKYIVRAK